MIATSSITSFFSSSTIFLSLQYILSSCFSSPIHVYLSLFSIPLSVTRKILPIFPLPAFPCLLSLFWMSFSFSFSFFPLPYLCLRFSWFKLSEPSWGFSTSLHPVLRVKENSFLSYLSRGWEKKVGT